MSGPKNPILVEAGRRGARNRWGEKRVVRLDELTASQRRLVVALIAAARSEQLRPDEPQAA